MFRHVVKAGTSAITGAGYIYNKTQEQSIRNRVWNEYAIVYLLEGIAERAGYCDLYFFSRQFRQLTGQTPGVFRKSI